jgi:hypothetical protein
MAFGKFTAEQEKALLNDMDLVRIKSSQFMKMVEMAEIDHKHAGYHSDRTKFGLEQSFSR